jgi:hypothetical protein
MHMHAMNTTAQHSGWGQSSWAQLAGLHNQSWFLWRSHVSSAAAAAAAADSEPVSCGALDMLCSWLPRGLTAWVSACSTLSMVCSMAGYVYHPVLIQQNMVGLGLAARCSDTGRTHNVAADRFTYILCTFAVWVVAGCCVVAVSRCYCCSCCWWWFYC